MRRWSALWQLMASSESSNSGGFCRPLFGTRDVPPWIVECMRGCCFHRCSRVWFPQCTHACVFSDCVWSLWPSLVICRPCVPRFSFVFVLNALEKLIVSQVLPWTCSEPPCWRSGVSSSCLWGSLDVFELPCRAHPRTRHASVCCSLSS